MLEKRIVVNDQILIETESQRHVVTGRHRCADAVNIIGNFVDSGAGFLIDDRHGLSFT